MAKPIIDSPTLHGQDAKHFQEMTKHVQLVSSAYIERFKQDVRFLREHADFSL